MFYLLYMHSCLKTYTSYRLLLYVLFVDVLHYILLQDRRNVSLLFFIYVYILIKFKQRPVYKTWVKISKVMPQPQVHFPGKGREALRQKVPNPSFKIWYGLTVHIIHF